VFCHIVECGVAIVLTMRVMCVDDQVDDEDNEDKENEMPSDSKEKKRKRVQCQ